MSANRTAGITLSIRAGDGDMCQLTWLELLKRRRTRVLGETDDGHEHLNARSAAMSRGTFELGTAAELFGDQEGAVKEGRRLGRNPAVLFEPLPVPLQVLCSLFRRHTVMIRRWGPSPGQSPRGRGDGALHRQQLMRLEIHLSHKSGKLFWVHCEVSVEGD